MSVKIISVYLVYQTLNVIELCVVMFLTDVGELTLVVPVLDDKAVPTAHVVPQIHNVIEPYVDMFLIDADEQHLVEVVVL